MSRLLPTVQGRRELLAKAARYTTLALLGASSASLSAKRLRLVRPERCINQGICASCDVFQKCVLPQALSAKQILPRINDGRK